MVRAGLVLGSLVLVVHLTSGRRHFLRSVRLGVLLAVVSWVHPIFYGGYGYHHGYGGIYEFRNYVGNINTAVPTHVEPTRTAEGMPPSSHFTWAWLDRRFVAVASTAAEVFMVVGAAESQDKSLGAISGHASGAP